MPKVPQSVDRAQAVQQEVPEHLQPYLFHRVDLLWRAGDKNAVADCPWCGREGKFSVLIGTGQWRCLVCNEGSNNGKPIQGGNIYTFLQKLKDISSTTQQQYEELAHDRQLLQVETLKSWGVFRSPIDGAWCVSGYSPEGKLINVYRYVPLLDKSGGSKFRLLGTKTLNHGLFGTHLMLPNRSAVYVCEGPWDPMALWEVMAGSKATVEGSRVTSNMSLSYLASCNVIGVPGCTTFLPSWFVMLNGCELVLMYDNDHPRKHPRTGGIIPPGGLTGMHRVAQLAIAQRKPPSTVSYLRWGEDGYNLHLPHGCDVRDMLTGRLGTEAENAAVRAAGAGIGIGEQENTLLRRLGLRLTHLDRLLGLVAPVPESWLKIDATSARADRSSSSWLRCSSFETLREAWRKALHWTDGLDYALSVMLSAVVSTKSVGDQLWIKVIGPASCGKSTLCEALSTNTAFIYAKSTIRGFHSGWREGGEDVALIQQIAGRTLITKDGDTLLQSPNLGQILSEARDLYDGTSRAHYRNSAEGKDYSGIRLTWILCGTSSLRQIDSSELGQRFLDCVIMDEIDEDLEDEILLRVAIRADAAVAIESGEQLETQHDPELAYAMQLTGGYVEHLRVNAAQLLSAVHLSEQAMRQCTRLGKFVAFMRARPSLKQEETDSREFGARLVSQHVRLAKCLSAVMGKTEADSEVMQRVKSVALDTARGLTLKILDYVIRTGGAESSAVALYIMQTEEKTRAMLRFLRIIGVLTLSYVESGGMRGKKPVWCASERLRTLYAAVLEIAQEPS